MSRRSQSEPPKALSKDADLPEAITGDGSGEALPPLEPPAVDAAETPADLEASDALEEGARAEAADSESEREVFLTTRVSEAFGPRGAFVTPTAEELAEAPEGLLVRPTPEQLAARP